MSAVVAVCKSNRIELLTDSIMLCSGTGTVRGFCPKWHALDIPRCVIAAGGLMSPTVAFSRQAWLRRIGDFDTLIDHADEIWLKIAPTVKPEDRYRELVGPYSITIAGWSDRRRDFELYIIDSRENCLSESLSILATGPCDETVPALNAFMADHQSDPDSFDARTDGIPLFEKLRSYERQFASARAYCVGGCIERTVISADGVNTEIIHHWADRIGEPIITSRQRTAEPRDHASSQI